MEGCSRFAIEAVPRQVACRLAPLQTTGVQQSTKELGGDGFCQPLLGAAPGLGKASWTLGLDRAPEELERWVVIAPAAPS